MRILLDTHTFIWFTEGLDPLSPTARRTIERPSNERLLSAVSLWEMAIKISIGKMRSFHPFAENVSALLERNGITLLETSFEHAAAYCDLELHHRDPFDRVLVAQALVESIPIVSADTVFDSYGIQRIW